PAGVAPYSCRARPPGAARVAPRPKPTKSLVQLARHLSPAAPGRLARQAPPARNLLKVWCRGRSTSVLPRQDAWRGKAPPEPLWRFVSFATGRPPPTELSAASPLPCHQRISALPGGVAQQARG
uniref:Uncharacterized protein n=1 Tax=Setaria italica TaxID=4555 RepID=A0A0Q3V650_SETIT